MTIHVLRLFPLLSLVGSLALVGCVTTPGPQPDPAPLPDATEHASAPRSTSPLVASAPGQSDRKTGRQPWEFTIGGAGTSNEDFNAGGAQIAGSIGYYTNEVIELSLRQNMSYADSGKGSPAAWNGVSRAAVDLHLPLGNVVPYVGANFGYVYGDTVKETFLAGPEAGVKFYLKEDVFVQAGAEYQFFFDSSDRVNDAFRDGQLVYGVGLGVRF